MTNTALADEPRRGGRKSAKVVKLETAAAGSARQLVIQPPKMQTVQLRINGTAPYVQHAFSQKARNTMIETQMLGEQSRKGRKRDPKNFDAVYEGAMHKSVQGWWGIPAPAFRNAMISACRMSGFKMTIGKLSIFVVADGFDAIDGTPLVKITKGAPVRHIAPARNAGGTTDIRCRPMWREGWEATVTIRFDLDQFSIADVVNLFSRAGMQVGVGEGRPDSPKSAGLGWGLWEIAK